MLLLKKLLQPKKLSKNYLKSKFRPLQNTIQKEYPDQIESYRPKESHLSATQLPQSPMHQEHLNIPIVFNNKDPLQLNIIKSDRKHILQSAAPQISMINELSASKNSALHAQINGLTGVDKEKVKSGKVGEGLKMNKLTGKWNINKEDFGMKGEEDSSKREVPVVLVAPKKGGFGGTGKNEFLTGYNDTEGGNEEKGLEARKKMTPSGVGNGKV